MCYFSRIALMHMEQASKDKLLELLIDVDIPNSTRLLHDEPLFTRPHVILPSVYPIEVIGP